MCPFICALPVRLLQALACVVLAIAAPPAVAQDEMEDVFGELGTASAEEGAEPLAPEAGAGAILGDVVDGATGMPLEGVTVIVIWPPPDDGSEAHQEVQVTDYGGGFEFPSIPSGRYTVTFVKSGFRASTMTDFLVEEGVANRADFPMPPMPVGATDDVMELDAFVVEASTVAEMMTSLELRMDSDQLLNIMSAEDLSKFAASDVADALKRVAGVNVVDGQFAIIRGLEDRYSSTTYNGAPVPSPDPESQSVQLDLFPSEVVGNLVVAKTFAPDLPSNSAGGSIDILTHEYPEEITLTFSGSGGWNDNATDRFLEYDGRNPVGKETDSDDVIESEFGGSVGGRTEYRDREIRFKAVLNDETDYETAEGWQQAREPDRPRTRRNRVIESGDLSLGDLSLSRGRFDLTESTKTEQKTAFFAAGVDVDPEGLHKLDGSFFWTDKDEEIVEAREDGYLPNVDYDPLLEKARLQGVTSIDPGSDLFGFVTQGSPLADSRTEGTAEDGQVFYAPIDEWRSFERDRDLSVYQLNGSHVLDFLDDLQVDWATNYAETNQEETSFGTRVFYEPEDPNGQIPDSMPTSVKDVGPGLFAINNEITYNSNDIEEDQYFGRLDFEYARPLSESLELTLKTGGWYEDAERDVDSETLLTPRKTGDAGNDFEILGSTRRRAAGQIVGDIGLFDSDSATIVSDTTNESSREIMAWHVGSKATFWDSFDVLGGVRIEDIEIESENDPFTGDFNELDGSPVTFPTRYLQWDRYDNPDIPFESAARVTEDTVFNDQLLGIQVPADPVTGLVDLPTTKDLKPLINGDIDEVEVLPSVGLAWRPLWPDYLEGLTLRAAYSQTVARPSFRELGFYVSSEPGSDDLIVGNPQLDLSDVESWDVRAEYLFGELGDLFALSFFVKEIDDPIEAIVITDPSNFDASSSVREFRTFFNNPSTADLWGLEFEGRLHLDFEWLGPAEPYLQYLSVGGNYTYIDAEVDRTDAELVRSRAFFGVAEGDRSRFKRLESSRRLFNQPEWIANADISFDHPDWGTKLTLAFFAISDVLRAAGSVSTTPDGNPATFTIDRYSDSFHQLDLVGSQRFDLPRELGALTFKMSIKNLTDSDRAVIYDREQTIGTIKERSFSVGRDYTFGLKYEYEFSF